ncbi:cyclin-like protein [Testicularia cyperi]|uniref:Cyclin-like protein n=1 Tax=Testicularia cyperi TaxID=1882483 RepID=A0A317XS09_9BASI|nr:cyclin-like protein [Testicularia cyperi]
MLYNTLASQEQVTATPSSQDGVEDVLEQQIRAQGCQLIQQAGILLNLPQRTMATAQVLFHRFWYVSSLTRFSARDIAMGALYLSTKLQETRTGLRRFLNAFHFALCKQEHSASQRHIDASNASLTPVDVKAASFASSIFPYRPLTDGGQRMYDLKNALVVAEMQILKRLGFNVHVILPYALLANYLQVLGLTDSLITVSNGLPPSTLVNQPDCHRTAAQNEESEDHGSKTCSLAQRAWSCLNDALQTPIYSLFPPHIIACAAIHLAARLTMPVRQLPMSPRPWWTLFDATEAEILTVCAHLMWHYRSSSGDMAAQSQNVVPFLNRHLLLRHIELKPKAT